MIGRLLAAIAVVAGVAAVYLYQRISSLDAVAVTDDVHMIEGLGGNVGVLATGDGAIVVDTMTFRLQGRRIRDLAERLGRGPTQAVINTHYHTDHTHGNPAFASGMRVVATERTLGYLHATDADYWSGTAAGTLPNETFEERHELRIGGKTIRLVHPGRGHTNGDLVALFVEDRVVHTGDLFFNGRYPNIDLEAGGSVAEWAASIDRVLELDFDHVIPGHGPVSDREGLRGFQRFIRQLAAVGAEAARSGASLDETRASAALDADTGYEVLAIPFVMRLDRDFAIRRAWEEATGRFEPIRLP
jgi:glyoxylase-like metal-dependent hydrolase (beta-lactamase superfamily II)